MIGDNEDSRAEAEASDELQRCVFLFGDRIYCSPGCVGDARAGYNDAEPGDLDPSSNVAFMRIEDAYADVVLVCARCEHEIPWINEVGMDE
jgi:hypothetical protein